MGKRIQTFEDLSGRRGHILKFTRDSGASWTYCKVAADIPSVVDPYGKLGRIQELGLQHHPLAHTAIHANRELEPGGVEQSSASLWFYFREPGFRVETTTPEEVAGKTFSYDSIFIRASQ